MINQVLTDPLFYFCAVPAVIIFGIAKGGFGGTLSIIAVPLISIAVPPAQAAAIMLPILCVMDLMAVRSYWREWHTANLRILLPASVTGILLGTVTFSYLSEAHIRILIGTIALSFVAHHWLKQQNKEAQPVNTWKGRLWGCIAGFTSFGIHAGGPPLSVYLLPQRLLPVST
ncbi:sulfite exporter TauE/SafE family protein [Pokkaliibacter plantistimulans]|uniref:sulfite exporter TauE/SafE family protein n=1 Tax=Pokkaliibacter plantistimulans TaxID=1635171 RepID=UPI0024342056|nr:sulfite exporter TauE/SafE family protein [Pokkaliibacter plantistimulans]